MMAMVRYPQLHGSYVHYLRFQKKRFAPFDESVD
jgi:hypothetical protein